MTADPDTIESDVEGAARRVLISSRRSTEYRHTPGRRPRRPRSASCHSHLTAHREWIQEPATRRERTNSARTQGVVVVRDGCVGDVRRGLRKASITTVPVQRAWNSARPQQRPARDVWYLIVRAGSRRRLRARGVSPGRRFARGGRSRQAVPMCSGHRLAGDAFRAARRGSYRGLAVRRDVGLSSRRSHRRMGWGRGDAAALERDGHLRRCADAHLRAVATSGLPRPSRRIRPSGTPQ